MYCLSLYTLSLGLSFSELQSVQFHVSRTFLSGVRREAHETQTDIKLFICLRMLNLQGSSHFPPGVLGEVQNCRRRRSVICQAVYASATTASFICQVRLGSSYDFGLLVVAFFGGDSTCVLYLPRFWGELTCVLYLPMKVFHTTHTDQEPFSNVLALRYRIKDHMLFIFLLYNMFHQIDKISSFLGI